MLQNMPMNVMCVFVRDEEVQLNLEQQSLKGVSVHFGAKTQKF
jgi:hypothetical protein